MHLQAERPTELGIAVDQSPTRRREICVEPEAVLIRNGIEADAQTVAASDGRSAHRTGVEPDLRPPIGDLRRARETDQVALPSHGGSDIEAAKSELPQ